MFNLKGEEMPEVSTVVKPFAEMTEKEIAAYCQEVFRRVRNRKKAIAHIVSWSGGVHPAVVIVNTMAGPTIKGVIYNPRTLRSVSF